MLPIPGKNSPAHQAVKKFQRGANLGNYLEAPKNQDWGQHYTEADFEHMITQTGDGRIDIEGAPLPGDSEANKHVEGVAVPGKFFGE